MIAAGGKKDLRFSFGHAVGKHWTAGAAVSVYTGTVTGNGKGSEMYEHELEFSDIIDDKEESMEASHSETVLMQFWPRKTYEGMFLMIGVKSFGSYCYTCASWLSTRSNHTGF